MPADSKEAPKIFMELKGRWFLLDGSEKGKQVPVGPGRYEVIRVKNPFGHPDANWLILKANPTIGATEKFLRGWENSENQDLRIVITEQ